MGECCVNKQLPLTQPGHVHNGGLRERAKKRLSVIAKDTEAGL